MKTSIKKLTLVQGLNIHLLNNYLKKYMKFFYSLSILILLSMIVNFEKANAQDKLSEFRNKYSVTYKFGLADGKETRTWAINSNTIQLERSFALNNLLSLSPVLSYSHLGGETLIKENMVSLGGNISIYPKYIADLIMGNSYSAINDKMFFNVGLQKTLSKADHTLLFNVDLNIYNFKLRNNSTLSPNIGYQQFISSEQGIKDLGFYTIGLNFRF